MLGRQLQAEQQALGDMTARDVSVVFGSQFDPAQARRSWPAIEQAVEQMIRSRNAASSALADRYYQSFRLAQGLGTLPNLPGGNPLTIPHLASIVPPAGLGTFLHEIGQGLPVQEALRIANDKLSQAAATTVLNGGRSAVINAVRADTEASGWMRMARPDACPFCAMLAGRVYPRSNAGFPAHNHCRCWAVPVFGIPVTPVGRPRRR